MILTVTMNASVDITYVLSEFQLGQTNRVATIEKTAGGKGLNVSRVLHQVKGQVCASGMLGGTTGEFIQNSLTEQGLEQHFYQIQQESRNNISIISGAEQTEILEAGPTVSEEEQQQFVALFKTLLGQVDTVVLSGSLPAGMKPSFYSWLVACAQEQGKQVLLDTSGAPLKESIEAPIKPTLIKPNEHELADLLGTTIDPDNLPDLKEKLAAPIFQRIPWLVVSLGAAGAIIKQGEEYYYAKVPKIQAVNAIGSGDSVIAGLALGLDLQEEPTAIIKRGMAYGVLNALEERPGYLKLAKLSEIIAQIEVSKI
ncbi:hexose kinase [Enterococcus sp. UD-01]|uniref:hexose kinase n=1 Tax=Enterococcus sp. UD-01 TaxID=3373911 RepID=UPI003838D411